MAVHFLLMWVWVADLPVNQAWWEIPLEVLGVRWRRSRKNRYYVNVTCSWSFLEPSGSTGAHFHIYHFHIIMDYSYTCPIFWFSESDNTQLMTGSLSLDHISISWHGWSIQSSPVGSQELLFKSKIVGTSSLAVQWLSLLTSSVFTAGGVGSLPDQGTKIPRAMAKKIFLIK